MKNSHVYIKSKLDEHSIGLLAIKITRQLKNGSTITIKELLDLFEAVDRPKNDSKSYIHGPVDFSVYYDIENLTYEIRIDCEKLVKVDD